MSGTREDILYVCHMLPLAHSTQIPPKCKSHKSNILIKKKKKKGIVNGMHKLTSNKSLCVTYQ